MKRILTVLLLTAIYGTLGSPVPLCPNSCSCSKSETLMEAHCNSFNFLTKLHVHKEEQGITSLYIKNTNLKEMDSNLKKLKNLKILSLKSNKLSSIKPTLLPSSLEYLDISQNLIKDLNEGWDSLENLKEINLFGNPICACDSIFLKDELITKDSAKFANCDSLKHARQTKLVVCRDFEMMQGDAAFEGSGSDDDKKVELIDDWNSSNGTILDPSVADEFEGSGDADAVTEANSGTTEDDDDEYDYGDLATETPFVPVIVTPDMTPLKTCYFNCSTPSPLDSSNETDVEPPPGLLDGIDILIKDLDILGSEETTAPPPTTPKVEIISTSKVDLVENITEIIDTKRFEQTKVGEDKVEKSQFSTYIFLGVLLILIICLIIYALIKKKQLKKKQESPVNKNGNIEHPEQEMQLLKNSEIKKPNGTHESVPLINGHNDQPPNDTNLINGNKFESIELRPKIKEEEEEKLLTPEAKRVTIKASEIPNSTPKTPILVTRHLSNDGNIVTTPYIDEEV